MESLKLGGSTGHIPFFDGLDFGYWKARMRAYLKSIDERVWHSVEIGYIPPMVSVTKEGVVILIEKPRDQWDENDYKLLG